MSTGNDIDEARTWETCGIGNLQIAAGWFLVACIAAIFLLAFVQAASAIDTESDGADGCTVPRWSHFAVLTSQIDISDSGHALSYTETTICPVDLTS